MSDNLRDTIRTILDPYLYAAVEENVLDQVAQAIAEHANQERRAAAESMRDKCAILAETHGITEQFAILAGKIRNLPLDTPDDGRG